MFEILRDINNPEDIKKLSINEMNILAEEIREALLNRVSNKGGHVGPNLGIVELTIAMHYVFNSPMDKIIFDVSHQSYPHKIITGRKNGYINNEEFNKVSGYTNPDESEHDAFKVGHTSTSISLACGVAKARDLKNEKRNVIAVIGDGSLSGGEALEGLNNASQLNSNLIIIVNDNSMSIAENHGGIYTNLELLRNTEGKAENNIFKAIGLDYCYIKEGNNIAQLIEVLNKVKDTSHPIVVHINTLKGKGLSYAEENKELWHWRAPFNRQTGEIKIKSTRESYEEITAEYLLNKAKRDKDVVVLTAATPGICGFTSEFRKDLGNQYVDVGIAEEHLVAFASGLAKSGAKPVVGIHSSFIQRAYDQLSQDLAINKSPAVILVYRGGISSADATHLGLFDITLISNIPNIVYLAPTCLEEYIAMLEWGIEQKEHPVVIRVPSQEVIRKNIQFDSNYSEINKYKIDKQGKDVCVIGVGNFYKIGEQVIECLEKQNIHATLIDPRYITGVDEELLEKIKDSHKVVITIEDGVLDGGFGEKISRFYGNSNIKVLNYGAKKEFTDSVKKEDLYTRYRLNPEQITQDIMNCLY